MCDNVLRLKLYVKIINLTISMLMAKLIFSLFGVYQNYFLEGVVGVILIFPVLSLVCYSFEESDYID